MQTILDVIPNSPAVQQIDAHQAAYAYLIAQIDLTFELVDSTKYYSKLLRCEVWRFFIYCEHGPIGTIRVNAQTGKVIQLTEDEIRAVCEKAAIFAAKQQGILPVNDHGYVLAAYARRQADGYLGTEVSLFYSATNGVFVPLARPIWQFTIQVRLPRLGVLGLMGTLDVDAQTGEVIPLTNKQIKRIRERADALVKFQAQPTTV